MSDIYISKSLYSVEARMEHLKFITHGTILDFMENQTDTIKRMAPCKASRRKFKERKYNLKYKDLSQTLWFRKNTTRQSLSPSGWNPWFSSNIHRAEAGFDAHWSWRLDASSVWRDILLQQPWSPNKETCGAGIQGKEELLMSKLQNCHHWWDFKEVDLCRRFELI